MPDIVLTTFNARYIHSSFGLRYVLANLKELRSRATIREYILSDRPVDVAEQLLHLNPRVIGIGVYIWNALQSLELVRILKTIRPEIIIVIGGPEVSYEIDRQDICKLADYVVAGEGDLAFADLCRTLLGSHSNNTSGEAQVQATSPKDKVVRAVLPSTRELALPYDVYDDDDVANRVIYVEASRGCPFRCEFCLSALDQGVRTFDPDKLLSALQHLLDRGVTRFKFVDRTFNLKIDVAERILTFFSDRYRPGMFIHFELIPDRLPDRLKRCIERFPAGSLQFEVGIQSFNPDVNRGIQRRQITERVEQNLAFLRRCGVHVHADLIVGLPGETIESFGLGFDRLYSMGPQEIQVGILKRLRGAPMSERNNALRYSTTPPYEVLQTDALDFLELQRLKRFARYWDMIANSGNFRDVLHRLPKRSPTGSMFHAFSQLSDWLYNETGQVSHIALDRLSKNVLRYLIDVLDYPANEAQQWIADEYRRSGRKLPRFLWSTAHPKQPHRPKASHLATLPPRQARHRR